MMRLHRPPTNEAFDAKVAKERERIRKTVEAGQRPQIAKSLWRDFKLDFSTVQHGRCGYCEQHVIAGQHGDVEHYAPKNELAEFGSDHSEEGTEIRYLAKLDGRWPSRRWAPGYWWLAYSWDNYLLACETCNAVWKGNLFPVKQPPVRVVPPSEAVTSERCVLLNPFGSRDPGRHLRFNPDGSVEPRNGSVYGRETIRTCGLNRLALRSARASAAERAFAAVLEARRLHSDGAPAEDNEGLADLYRMGRDTDESQFPGVVRAIILDQLAPLTWADLAALLE